MPYGYTNTGTYKVLSKDNTYTKIYKYMDKATYTVTKYECNRIENEINCSHLTVNQCQSVSSNNSLQMKISYKKSTEIKWNDLQQLNKIHVNQI